MRRDRHISAQIRKTRILTRVAHISLYTSGIWGADEHHGPFGLIKDLREWVGTPLTCSVSAAFWLWLLGAPLLLWGRLTGALLLQYGGALGVAYAVLALAGALDLDR